MSNEKIGVDGSVADGEKDVGKDAGDVEKRADEIANKKIESAQAEKAIAVYDRLNERYKADPSFRDEFDKIWAGVKPDNGAADDGADDLEPIEQLRKELKDANEKIAKTNSEIESLRNVYGYDKLSDSRSRTNLRYENDFRNLASDIGYDPGSDAYETLYADVLREGRVLAKKFGLVSEDGNVDPLKEYKSEFLKAAFEAAHKRHERAGFVDAWQRKKHAESLKHSDVKDELKDYFDPKKLTTPEKRAAAIERAFRHKFGNDTKMV